MKLGHVPQIHQTDNSTAATHTLSVGESGKTLKERGFNEEYLQLLSHYGIQAQTIHVGNPNENGDVESSNGGLKSAIKQHLLLRGNRDFESLETYEAFLYSVMDKRNAGRQAKLEEELAVMKPLSVKPWQSMRELQVRVGNNGILRVSNNGYTVPSGLKRKWVKVKVYEWRIEVWYANRCVETLPRLIGMGNYRINYRHVIDSLLRKPGGFRNYRYRDDLFPQAVFREAWEHLDQRLPPRKADMIYLRILKLAARGLETDVAEALKSLLSASRIWDDGTVAERVQPARTAAPKLSQQDVNLSVYDQLLSQEVPYV